MWIQKLGKINPDFYVLGTVQTPVFLVKTRDSWILIEGGVSNIWEQVLSQLKDVVGDLNKVKYWFITHSHYDHCGLLEVLTPYIPNVQIVTSSLIRDAFQSKSANKVIKLLNQEILTDREAFEKQEKYPLSSLNLNILKEGESFNCLLYTSPSPRDA